MKGVKFGAYHSYNDFGLILSKVELESPTVKEVKQEIKGADSDLDLTDFFGEPKYENARHRFTFSTLAISETEFLSLASTIKNALHGKKVRIILDDDPAFYYVGRVFVSKYHNERQIGTVEIECDCEPYKYKLEKTVVSAKVDGTTQNLYNISKVPADSFIKTDDGFCIIDIDNTGSVSDRYIIMSHAIDSTASITPNQAVTLVMEIQYCDTEPEGTTYFYFTNNFPSQPDYFTPSAYAVPMKSEEDKIVVYQTAIKDSATIAKATLFMRSYFAIPAGAYIKAKFRISVVQGTVNSKNFVYHSADGKMKGLKLSNLMKRAVPTITATNAFTIYHEGNAYSIALGTTTIPELEFKKGINDIAVKGTGTISFAWNEGCL